MIEIVCEILMGSGEVGSFISPVHSTSDRIRLLGRDHGYSSCDR